MSYDFDFLDKHGQSFIMSNKIYIIQNECWLKEERTVLK